jgi:putative acetyltransferase
MNITIRKGVLADLTELQQLFVGTVTTVCKTDYTDQQIKVWASSIENKDRWLYIVTKQFLLVAEDQERIVGFCSLEKNNEVDLLYVHKDYQGKEIASRLYAEIEKEAIKKGQTQLIADVSITARPFFEKMGFTVIEEQTVLSQGVKLTNFRMAKTIGAHREN